jgi:hypothetical protein
MRRTRILMVAAILAASLCAGCFAPPTVVLVNDSGGDVLLSVAAENYGEAPRDLVVRLKQGADREFPEGFAHIRGVRIQAHSCVYRYDLPELDDPIEPLAADGIDRRSRYLQYPVIVQLERDRKLYLADLRERPRGGGGKLTRQVLGFPLSPASSSCS